MSRSRSTSSVRKRVVVDHDRAVWHEKVLFVMVGLPARGKSYIANKIVNYMKWQGARASLFNVGKFRRDISDSSEQDSGFFDASNASAKSLRDDIAYFALERTLDELEQQLDVAVFDATNTTEERRSGVLDRCYSRSKHVNVIFIESICTDAALVRNNMLQKVRNSPDFLGISEDDGMADLEKRLENYEMVYQTIEGDLLSYIKLINLQSKVICNRVTGAYAHLVTAFLMCCHQVPRPIYLIRSGRVKYDTVNLNSKDFYLPSMSQKNSGLNSKGSKFAKELAEFLEEDTVESEWSLENLVIYTSLLKRSLQTIAPTVKLQDPELARQVRAISALNMLDTGICHGMSKQHIYEHMPDEAHLFEKDRFQYRFPGGESQSDLARRLVSFVKELERHSSPVLVVSHLSTLQVLYGYFTGSGTEEFFDIDFPQHTVVKLVPSNYGWTEYRTNLETKEHTVLHHGHKFYKPEH